METISNTIKKTEVRPQSLSELYSDIELTPEEREAAIEKALFDARYEKYAMMKKREWTQNITAPQVHVRYTRHQLKTFLEEQEGFDIDDDNEKIVDLLCMYFTDDPEFEKMTDHNGKEYSLDKGIILFGPVGVGKTLLLEMFRNNQKQSYQVVTCEDVENNYAKNGPDFHPQTGAPGLRKYFGLVNMATKNQYGHDTLGFLFDDLGQEIKNTKHFGTERNVMREVISQRYKNKLFTSTHITTNISADTIKEVYDVRVADRMREMFNLLSFPEDAKSRRK